MSTTINITINVNSDGKTTFSAGKWSVTDAIANQYFFTAPDAGANIPVAEGDTVNVAVKVVVPYPSVRIYSIRARIAMDVPLFGKIYLEQNSTSAILVDTDPSIPNHRQLEYSLPITRPPALIFPTPVEVELGLMSNDVTGTDQTVHRTRTIYLVDPIFEAV